jgi:hypothetical protein
MERKFDLDERLMTLHQLLLTLQNHCQKHLQEII